MTHSTKCIKNYKSAINYNTAYSKVAYKYFLKAFYGQINKMKYELQILQHNIRHINVIAMQDAILKAKIPVVSSKNKEIVVDTSDAEVTQVCITINVLLKYNWHLHFTKNEAAVNLGL